MLAKAEILLRIVGLTIKRFLNWLEAAMQPTPGERAAIYGTVGKRCADRGQTADAITALKTAIDISPSDIEAHYKLGLAYSKNGSWDEAIGSYNKTLALKGKNGNGNGMDTAAVHYRLALCHDKKSNFDEAIKSCRESLKLSPERPNVHYRLGSLYDRKKNHGQSIKAYQKAIELDPDKAKYHYSLGLAYDGNDEHEKAIDCFRHAMEAEETTTEEAF